VIRRYTQVETSWSIRDQKLVWVNKLRVTKLEMDLLAVDRPTELNGKLAAASALRGHPIGPTGLDQIKRCADFLTLFRPSKIASTRP
jgi:hypothetical protein